VAAGAARRVFRGPLPTAARRSAGTDPCASRSRRAACPRQAADGRFKTRASLGRSRSAHGGRIAAIDIATNAIGRASPSRSSWRSGAAPNPRFSPPSRRACKTTRTRSSPKPSTKLTQSHGHGSKVGCRLKGLAAGAHRSRQRSRFMRSKSSSPAAAVVRVISAPQ
jgi:hypothetical protein